MLLASHEVLEISILQSMTAKCSCNPACDPAATSSSRHSKSLRYNGMAVKRT